MRTPIFGNCPALSNTSRFLCPHGNAAVTSSETVPQQWRAPVAGWISNLFISQATAGSTTTRSYTVVVNGVASTLTCDIAVGASTNSDILHVVAVAAGDTVSIQTTSSVTTGTTGVVSTGLMFQAGDGVASVLVGSSDATTLATVATRYLNVCGQNTVNATAANVQQVIPAAGTISTSRLSLSGAPGTSSSGKGYTATLWKNGSPTSLTMTVSDTATEATDSNAGHAVTVAAGDLVYWAIVPSLTPTARTCRIDAKFVPTVAGTSIHMMGTDLSPSVVNTTFNYNQTTGTTLSWQSTDAARKVIMPVSGGAAVCVTAWITNAPGTSNIWEFGLDINGTNTTTFGGDTAIGTAAVLSTGTVINRALTSADPLAITTRPIQFGSAIPSPGPMGVGFAILLPVVTAAGREAGRGAATTDPGVVGAGRAVGLGTADVTNVPVTTMAGMGVGVGACTVGLLASVTADGRATSTGAAKISPWLPSTPLKMIGLTSGLADNPNNPTGPVIPVVNKTARWDILGADLGVSWDAIDLTPLQIGVYGDSILAIPGAFLWDAGGVGTSDAKSAGPETTVLLDAAGYSGKWSFSAFGGARSDQIRASLIADVMGVGRNLIITNLGNNDIGMPSNGSWTFAQLKAAHDMLMEALECAQFTCIVTIGSVANSYYHNVTLGDGLGAVEANAWNGWSREWVARNPDRRKLIEFGSMIDSNGLGSTSTSDLVHPTQPYQDWLAAAIVAKVDEFQASLTGKRQIAVVFSQARGTDWGGPGNADSVNASSTHAYQGAALDLSTLDGTQSLLVAINVALVPAANQMGFVSAVGSFIEGPGGAAVIRYTGVATTTVAGDTLTGCSLVTGAGLLQAGDSLNALDVRTSGGRRGQAVALSSDSILTDGYSFDSFVSTDTAVAKQLFAPKGSSQTDAAAWAQLVSSASSKAIASVEEDASTGFITITTQAAHGITAKAAALAKPHGPLLYLESLGRFALTATGASVGVDPTTFTGTQDLLVTSSTSADSGGGRVAVPVTNGYAIVSYTGKATGKLTGCTWIRGNSGVILSTASGVVSGLDSTEYPLGYKVYDVPSTTTIRVQSATGAKNRTGRTNVGTIKVATAQSGYISDYTTASETRLTPTHGISVPGAGSGGVTRHFMLLRSEFKSDLSGGVPVSAMVLAYSDSSPSPAMTWTKSSTAWWPPSTNYEQPFQRSGLARRGGFVYMMSPGANGTVVARCPELELLTIASWRYWDGSTWNSDITTVAPLWIDDQPLTTFPRYHDANACWIVTYVDQVSGSVLLRSASSPEGPWSTSQVLASPSTFTPTTTISGGAPHPFSTGSDVYLHLALSEPYTTVLAKMYLGPVDATGAGIGVGKGTATVIYGVSVACAGAEAGRGAVDAKRVIVITGASGQGVGLGTAVHTATIQVAGAGRGVSTGSVVTTRLIEGASALSGAGALTADGTFGATGGGTLTGLGTATIVGTRINGPGEPGVLDGSGSLTATGHVVAEATAALSGGGTIHVTGRRLLRGAAVLAGFSSGTIVGSQIVKSTATMSGSGSAIATAANGQSSGALLNGSGSMVVIGRTTGFVPSAVRGELVVTGMTRGTLPLYTGRTRGHLPNQDEG